VQSARWCTQCHISEDPCLHIHHCENLRYICVVIHRVMYCTSEHVIYIHSGILHISTDSFFKHNNESVEINVVHRLVYRRRLVLE
jgi:hypothetical protein